MKNKAFNFDFETMTLEHGIQYDDGFFPTTSIEMTIEDIEKLQFILWSVHQELKNPTNELVNEYVKSASVALN